MNEKIMKQEATYDWLKDEVHCLHEEKKELQDRIEKAIEYIENKYNYILKDDTFLNHDERIDRKQILNLLDILKGSDSND